MRRPLAVLLAVAGTLLLTVGLSALPAAVGGARAVDPGYARLTLTELTPSMVTTAGGDTVRVRGELTNTFDRPLSDLRIVLRLGDRVADALGLRTSLMVPASGFPVAGPPHSLSATLAPRTSTSFDVEVPVSAADGLRIRETGVYPLQIVATGIPESGGTVSLAESRTLLPVLSLPADAQRATGFVDPADGGGDPRLGRDGSLAPDTTAPATFTMVWPLAAPPQLAPGVLGGNTEPVRLLGDHLATSLTPTGRLGTQLETLQELVGDDADARLRSSICLGVDPDLLATVHGMTLGYAVTTDPADPRSPTRPGTGRQAAAQWLDKLRGIAAQMCVVPLPFAQAGLDSLHTIDDAELSATAVSGTADFVDGLLGVQSLRGLTLPAVGTLSEAGRDVLAATGSTGAAIAASSVDPVEFSRAGRYRTGPVALQTYDMPISAALGAAGTAPVVPAIMPNWQRPELRSESAASRRSAAVAALAFPMLTPPATDSARLPVTGRSAFVLPPTYWSPTLEDGRALLEAAGLLLAARTAEPLGLNALVEQLTHDAEATRLVTPGDVDPLVAQGFPISEAAATEVRRLRGLNAQLQASLVGSPTTVTTPQAYTGPLNEDLLRAVATPESQTLGEAGRLRSLRIAAVDSTLNRMKQAVALLDPGGRYTLASERSPLLLVVRNDLALPIRVRMEITAPAALNVGDVGVQEIPPLGTRQIQIPTHADTSERATVDIALVSSTGIPLSEPISLSIFSNAYGKPLFWITITAAVALVLLTARRLWHRFRGEPDPADEDRPEPDAHELWLASTPYEQRVNLAREEHTEADDGDVTPDDRRES